MIDGQCDLTPSSQSNSPSVIDMLKTLQPKLPSALTSSNVFLLAAQRLKVATSSPTARCLNPSLRSPSEAGRNTLTE